jgi:hypothetical protein
LEWDFDVILSFNPSKYNYARIYIASDNCDNNSGINGYYVLVGNTNDEIALYKESENNHTRLITAEKRVDRKSSYSKIKVIRHNNNFKLYSLVDDDGDYIYHGESNSDFFPSDPYFGVCCVYTKSYSTKFAFDNFIIKNSGQPIPQEPGDNNQDNDNPSENGDDDPPEEDSDINDTKKRVKIDSIVCTTPTSIVIYFDKEIKRGKFYLQSHDNNFIAAPASNLRIWEGSFDIPMVEGKTYTFYGSLMYDIEEILQNPIVYSFKCHIKDEIPSDTDFGTAKNDIYYIYVYANPNIEVYYSLPLSDFNIESRAYTLSGKYINSQKQIVTSGNKGKFTVENQQTIVMPCILEVTVKAEGRSVISKCFKIF